MPTGTTATPSLTTSFSGEEGPYVEQSDSWTHVKSQVLSGHFLGGTNPADGRERRGGGLLTSERSEKLRSLYETYCPRVLAYALRRTSREEAEEVVAETFIVAWRRLPEVPDDPMPWLLAVARRVLANQRRATGRKKALDQRLGSAPRPASLVAPDPAEEVGARMALDTALRHLSEWDREALLLVAWEGLDNRRAAVVLNCSPASFAVRLHRARRRLTQHLHRIEPNAPDPRATRAPSLEEGK
jgi:RNA polymerase sigma-70 factor (ECF subfamily)